MAYNVTILTDKTSWMNVYNLQLKKQLEDLGCYVRLIASRAELEEGDVAFFLSCFEILPASKLSLHKHNIVVHASDLPHGKGWSPSTWQILEGKNKIPLTLFEANEKCDSGVIYLKDVFELQGHELLDEWQSIMGKKIVEMCVSFMKQYPDICSKGREQEGVESFYARRSPKDSELNIHQSLAAQFNLLRVVDNKHYPAFFELHGRRYKLEITACEAAPSIMLGGREFSSIPSQSIPTSTSPQK